MLLSERPHIVENGEVKPVLVKGDAASSDVIEKIDAPSTRRYPTISQVISPNTEAVIAFHALDYDDSNGIFTYDGTNHRLYVSEAGTYLFTTGIFFNSTPASGRTRISFRVNGGAGNYPGIDDSPAIVRSAIFSTASQFKLKAGDYIQVNCNSANATAIQTVIQATATYLTAVKLESTRSKQVLQSVPQNSARFNSLGTTTGAVSGARKVPMSTQEFNDGNIVTYNSSTRTYTVNESGNYIIGWNYVAPAWASGSYTYFASIFAGGAEKAVNSKDQPIGAATYNYFETPVKLIAGQEVFFQFHSTGATVDIGNLAQVWCSFIKCDQVILDPTMLPVHSVPNSNIVYSSSVGTVCAVNTVTKIKFPTKASSSGPDFITPNAAFDGFTVKDSGLYRISATVQPIVGGANVQLIVYYGSSARRIIAWDNSLQQEINWEEYASAGTIISIGLYTNIAGTTGTNISCNNISITKVDQVILKDETNQVSNSNLFINSNFQVWQRGTTFAFSANTNTGLYTADRWNVVMGNNMASYVYKTSMFPSFDQSYQMLIHHQGTNATSDEYIRYFPEYEDMRQYSGKKVTISGKIKLSKSGTSDPDSIPACVIVYRNGGTLPNLYIGKRIEINRGDNNFAVTLEFPVIEGASRLQIQVLFNASAISPAITQGITTAFNCPSCYLQFGEMKLEHGEYPTPYQYPNMADEVNRCYRYFYRTGVFPTVAYYTGWIMARPTPQVMRINLAPINFSANVVGGSAISLVSILNGTPQGFSCLNVSPAIATGTYCYVQYDLDAEIY